MLKANHRIIETLFDRESNLEWKDDFYFVQAADTQFGQFDRMGEIDRDQLDGKLPWYREVQLAERAVTLINQLDPKPMFMIICGDMLDNFFYKLVPDIEDRIFTDKLDSVRDQQFDSFMEVFSKLDQCIPLICVCGNHDVGDSPNKPFIDRYKSQFGDDYFAFYLDGVVFISLNSNYYYDSKYCEDLEEEQNKWLDRMLDESKKSKFKHVVIFLHIPLFVNEYNEPTSFLNIPIEKRKILVTKFRNAGVKKVFCGHIHTNSIAHYKDLEVVSTSALGPAQLKDNGFRVVKVEENAIKHEYYHFDECPTKLDR